MHNKQIKVQLSWGGAVCGRFRQLLVLIECFPPVALSFKAQRRQAEDCLLLDGGGSWGASGVCFADGGVEGLRSFFRIARQ